MALPRLTDEHSEIADRLTVAAHSWGRPDAMEARLPEEEAGLLMDAMNELNARRLHIAELEVALRDLTEACVAEFGDGTDPSSGDEPDDSSVFAGVPDGEGITFGMLRRAQAALGNCDQRRRPGRDV